jgi:hypothetical protein
MRKQKIVAYLVIALIFISVVWISRKIVFKYVFEKIKTKTESRYDLNVQVKSAEIIGIRTICLTGLTITTKQGASVIQSDSMAFEIKPFPLLIGKIRFNSIALYNTKFSADAQLIRFFKNKRNIPAENDTIHKIQKSVNYTGILSNISDKVFSHLPNQILLRNTSFTYSRDSIHASVVFENFVYRDHEFLGDILLSDNSINDYCFISGSLNPSRYSFTCKINNSKNKNIKFPYLGPRWQAAFGFDSLNITCNYKELNSQHSTLTGNAAANNLLFFYKPIGPDTIVIRSGNIQFNWNINDNNIELDSSSVIGMNRFSFSPYIRYIKQDTSSKLDVAFIRKEFNADDLFSSLPSGLFTNFRGIETSGKLAFHLKASLDFANPDSSTFSSALENHGFSINKYGETDFRMMNGPFIYEAYDNNQLISTFPVGPDNPDFVPLDQISSYLKFSVLTSEDGDFYYHRGFNEKAFIESIAKNIKEKRFARGGSTITMQLVKNVFLNRKKIISRKVEEALIVWIIENLRLTSKDRMFEVYLNVIEWGPHIYGIKQASKFYFNKQPKDLNLSESIYLTSLIPRPKWFKYTFDENGQIRGYMGSYYQLLTGIMVRRNQILPEDTINLRPIKKLTGEAKNFLTQSDTIKYEDSLYFLKPMELLHPDFEQ